MYSQVDFVKYFDGEKVNIETFDEEDGDFFINDKKILLKDIALLSYEGSLKANVYSIDYEKVKDIRNLDTEYLFADRIVKGKVNLFEYKLVTGSNKHKFGRLFFNEGDGKVEIADFKNLKPILSSNPESYKYLKKAKSAIVTKKVLAWVGISTAAVGFGMLAIEAARGGDNYAIGGIVGGAGFSLFMVTFFIDSTKNHNKNIKKAIESY